MTDTSIHIEIAKAIPVVVGGLLALFGGLLGQFFTHRLTLLREQRALRRERLESLVKALFAHSQWLDEKHNNMLLHKEESDRISPLDEVRMLQILHFPELAQEIISVLDAELMMINFNSEQRIAQRKGNEEWLKSWDGKPYLEAHKKYHSAIAATLLKCRESLIT